MPKFNQQFFAIEGLDVLKKSELAKVIDMVTYASEKPITVKTHDGLINYPLFYPAIKNEGLKGFLKTKEAFEEDRYGETLSSDEIHHIIENGSQISDLIELLYETPLYAEAEIKKQSRGRPNLLLKASLEFQLEDKKEGMLLFYDIKGENSAKSNEVMKSLGMKGVNHHLAIIESNLSKIQNYVYKPDDFNQILEENRQDIYYEDDGTTEFLFDIFSDFYWDVMYDPWYYDNYRGGRGNIIDVSDVISKSVRLGRSLDKIPKIDLDNFGKNWSKSSSDPLRGIGDLLGSSNKTRNKSSSRNRGKSRKKSSSKRGSSKSSSSFDIDVGDSGELAAVILIIVAGVAVTALLTAGIVHGTKIIKRELLDYNLIWLDRNGQLMPSKSRLPLRLIKDIQDQNK